MSIVPHNTRITETNHMPSTAAFYYNNSRDGGDNGDGLHHAAVVEAPPHPSPRLPRCLKVLPLQLACHTQQLVAGVQRLDALLARTIAELRADSDGSVFGAGWPRGTWPAPRVALADQQKRGAWLVDETPEGIASALCSASPVLLRDSHAPLQFLGAGSYGAVFGAAGGGVALKFAVPCPFTWFSPKHEFETQAHLAASGAAFGVSDLLNRRRAECLAHEASWRKGTRGAEFLTKPTLRRLSEAVRDCVCVLVMERADGVLADYFARPPQGKAAVLSPEEHGAAVGDALVQLLRVVRESGAVHNDSKVDNVGYLRGRWSVNGLPVFRFMDCGLSFRRQTLACVNDACAEKALVAGGRRDGCMLIASLLSLAQELRGQSQKRACEAAAWRLASDPCFGCLGLTTAVDLDQAARACAKEAARSVKNALRALRAVVVT